MTNDTKALNFIEHIIEDDIKNGLDPRKLRFRFPPEPNGYLHIGHTKAINISFGLGEKYNAPVNLRFDDTNPVKEEQDFVDAIKRDIKWLGYSWDKEVYSSDYFQQLYDWAVVLIKESKAYIDSQSSEAMAIQKGTPTQPGTNSPFRDRSIEDNLKLFEAMKNCEFKEGEHVLRAKIDMTHPNMLMRDPIMYRVLHKPHHRTGTKWCIYPLYDWTHGESDYLEQISHSLCSLEFKPHRELYNWFRENVYNFASKEEGLTLIPKQREFARLNLSYTIMSKRKLARLIEEGYVNGWDDPRMPTISGLRRRGYTPESIKNFITAVGVAKRDNVIDVSLLEFHVREHLNQITHRVMAVLNPVKLIITNYPEGKEEYVSTENNPEDKDAGERKIPFSKTLYIEREDFKEEANSKFFRLSLGNEVRLKSAYIIKAEHVVKDSKGEITEIHCSYDPDSLSGSGTEASLRKVKGTLHWVSVKHAIEAEVREYDRLFNNEFPDGDKDKDFIEYINPNSLTIKKAFVEPSLQFAKVGDRFQFQRIGYFVVDKNSSADALIFNKTVGLRDTWAKVKPKATQVDKKKVNQQQPKQKAIDSIKKLGKKYAQVSTEKQAKLKAEIVKLAKNVSYYELEPLFNTAVKKTGTRIITAIVLGVLFKNGHSETDQAKAFLKSALDDKNDVLVAEAKVAASFV